MSMIDSSIMRSLFDLYRSGQFETLVKRTRDLLHAHPDQVALHSLLGAACLELGQLSDAIESYQAALAIRPDFAKAHNSLGIAHLRSGQVENAAGSFARAIDCDPQFAEPCFNLGVVRENQRRLKEAAELHEQAVGLEPGYNKARCALARLLWELGDYDRVVRHYELALADDAGYVPAHRGVMQFLEQSNRHDELRAALARARAALGADHALVRFQEGMVADVEGDSAAAKALLESCPMEPSDPVALHDERMRLSRLVAICDKLGDVGAAMGYAAGANRLSHQSCAGKGIDKRRFLEFVENRKQFFAAANVEPGFHREDGSKAPEHQGTDIGPVLQSGRRWTRQPVFIIGFPRSGTTLIDTALRGHPAIEVAEESDAVPGMVNVLSGASDERLPSLGELSSTEVERARTLYFNALKRQVQASDATSCVIDRFALNMVYVGEIHRVFPNAKFILMLRHPADCVLSCYLRAFVETSANASFHTLEEASHLYDQVLSLWTLFTERLDLNLIEIKYEELVADFEFGCRRALEFIDVPWHPRVLDHKRTARSRPYIRTASYNQVVQPLHTEASGRWLRYRTHMEPVLPMLEPWIERLGYERAPEAGIA
ncbi:MAG: sulfotransferase [Gammaproteobacteria bacterium]|nr:sulfotransferase [Gammaproteobacteria bacterium]